MRSNWIWRTLQGLRALGRPPGAVAPVPEPLAAPRTATSGFSHLLYPYPTQALRLPLAETPELEVAYMDVGPAQPQATLLLLHGLGSYAPSWVAQLRGLSPHYRLVAPDLPGYGQSTVATAQGGPLPISMDYYCRAVEAMIDTLHLDPLVLVGHSMGGHLALHLALRRPELYSRLVLLAPAGLEPFSADEGRMLADLVTGGMLATTRLEEVRQLLAYNFYRIPPEAEFMVADRLSLAEAPLFGTYCANVAACVRAMLQAPVLDQLKRMRLPTLLMFGDRDRLIPNKTLHPLYTTESVAASAAALLPDCRRQMLPLTGHFLQLEAAPAVNQAIREWVG